MNILKHTFKADELEKFVLNFHEMEIRTEPLTNLLVACAHLNSNPLIEYYNKQYFSSDIYYNYVSASSIIIPYFLKHHFDEHHFTFFSRLKHNNYILDYGQSQFLVSSSSKELISSIITIENIDNHNQTIKDIIGFSLKFQQMLTFYGLSADVPSRFQNFFKRMISHPEIHKVITTNYDDELNHFDI